MAQLVEQRIRNAWVTSSSLVIGSFLAQEVFSAACPRRRHAVIAQLVERRLPKPNVAGSSPVYRSSRFIDITHIIIDLHGIKDV